VVRQHHGAFFQSRQRSFRIPVTAAIFGLVRIGDRNSRAPRHARVVDEPNAFPCRISLTDADVGDEGLLINHELLPVNSPYRSRHAIFIRANETAFDAVDQVPDMLRRRLLSLRAFDRAGMMTGCDVVEGRELEAAIAGCSPNRRHLSARALRAAQLLRGAHHRLFRLVTVARIPPAGHEADNLRVTDLRQLVAAGC
jgi:hypothetical protein